MPSQQTEKSVWEFFLKCNHFLFTNKFLFKDTNIKDIIIFFLLYFYYIIIFYYIFYYIFFK